MALQYDYGKQEQGYSFEHYNFYDTLVRMGHKLIYFDFRTIAETNGREWMNHRLLELVRAEKPDLMFTVLALDDKLDPRVIREISERTGTVTLNWFCDDHYRFNNYSCYWAPSFNWVITTDQNAVAKYADLGYRNAIKSQWACNNFSYRKLELPLKYDVTFVGQPYGNRRSIIQRLRDTGIRVEVWGTGWETTGRVSQEGMIQVFNESRINLNLTNAGCPVSHPAVRRRSHARRWLSRCLDVVPFGAELKATGKLWLSKVQPGNGVAIAPIEPDLTNLSYPQQIKGRNFEVPGCGGFLLTERAEELEQHYEIGKEIVCFDDVDDLIEKVRYYLCHEDERAEIAQAGYCRTLREHTYVHRFQEIFERLKLSA